MTGLSQCQQFVIVLMGKNIGILYHCCQIHGSDLMFINMKVTYMKSCADLVERLRLTAY